MVQLLGAEKVSAFTLGEVGRVFGGGVLAVVRVLGTSLKGFLGCAGTECGPESKHLISWSKS